MTLRRIADIARDHVAGSRAGIASICTAHPMVVETTLRHGGSSEGPVLIEAKKSPR